MPANVSLNVVPRTNATGAVAYYDCRICGGYVGLNVFDEHDTTDCLIELRCRIDDLESEGASVPTTSDREPAGDQSA